MCRCFFFFFSSRRRHTRFDCDWSSDVCSSDLAGRVDGTLLVINGDAILDTGAVVTGDVIVVGGTVARSPTAVVSGELRVYTAPLAYRIRGEEIALAPPDLRRWFRRLGIEKSWGTADSRSSLTLATGGTFNRVKACRWCSGRCSTGSSTGTCACGWTRWACSARQETSPTSRATWGTCYAPSCAPARRRDRKSVV